MKIYIKHFSVVVSFFLLVNLESKAQNLENLKEFFTFYPNRKAVEKDSTRYLQKFIAAPIVSFSPETNFAFGTGAKYLFKFNY